MKCIVSFLCACLCVCVRPLVCHADFSKTTAFTHSFSEITYPNGYCKTRNVRSY